MNSRQVDLQMVRMMFLPCLSFRELLYAKCSGG